MQDATCNLCLLCAPGTQSGPTWTSNNPYWYYCLIACRRHIPFPLSPSLPFFALRRRDSRHFFDWSARARPPPRAPAAWTPSTARLPPGAGRRGRRRSCRGTESIFWLNGIWQIRWQSSPSNNQKLILEADTTNVDHISSRRHLRSFFRSLAPRLSHSAMPLIVSCMMHLTYLPLFLIWIIRFMLFYWIYFLAFYPLYIQLYTWPLSFKYAPIWEGAENPSIQFCNVRYFRTKRNLNALGAVESSRCAAAASCVRIYLTNFVRYGENFAECINGIIGASLRISDCNLTSKSSSDNGVVVSQSQVNAVRKS